jgi:D-allose transport system ATP-binding protein
MNDTCVLRVTNVTKEFPGTIALDSVSFDLYEGEVHALVGENGAGKSTLMKILSGAYSPTTGEIEFGGQTYTGFTPKQSAALGISIIYQELSLINVLTIAENLFLGRLPHKTIAGMKFFDNKKLDEMVKTYLQRVGLELSGNVFVEDLKISQKQLVEIAKALSLEARILIMDEPTTSLAASEIELLWKLVKDLTNHGVSVILISHNIKEVLKIADRITVLKDGKIMGTKNVKDITIDEVVNLMVGKELKFKYSDVRKYHKGYQTNDTPVLEVKNLTAKERAREINFKVYEKEIVGFFGLIGAGRTDVMRAIFGADGYKSGELYLRGQKLEFANPYAALKYGIGLVPENRREEGIINVFSIWQNMSLPFLQKQSSAQGLIGRTNPNVEKDISSKYRDLLKVKCTSIEQSIGELSGGNQQKVVIGKWLASDSDLVIFDEPTKGIDVGAKSDIYQIILDLAASGKTIMVISSEYEELLSICSRIYVLREGKIVAEYPIDSANEENLLYSATVAH